MKPYIPQIRIISVDHDRTSTAEAQLKHALQARGMAQYPVRSTFCHLEAGRCGLSSGVVALELDGCIIWQGAELSQKLAEQFCDGLPGYIQRQKQEYGLV